MENPRPPSRGHLSALCHSHADAGGRRTAGGRARRKLSLFGRAHGSYELDALESHTEEDEGEEAATRPRAPSVEDLLRAVDADASATQDEAHPSPANTIYANQAAITGQRQKMRRRQQSVVRRETGSPLRNGRVYRCWNSFFSFACCPGRGRLRLGQCSRR